MRKGGDIVVPTTCSLYRKSTAAGISVPKMCFLRPFPVLLPISFLLHLSYYRNGSALPYLLLCGRRPLWRSYIAGCTYSLEKPLKWVSMNSPDVWKAQYYSSWFYQWVSGKWIYLQFGVGSICFKPVLCVYSIVTRDFGFMMGWGIR